MGAGGGYKYVFNVLYSSEVTNLNILSESFDPRSVFTYTDLIYGMYCGIYDTTQSVLILKVLDLNI